MQIYRACFSLLWNRLRSFRFKETLEEFKQLQNIIYR